MHQRFLLDNKCPKCDEGAIVSFISLNRECENCGYVFESEPGAFTGALYLNLTIVGLSTFPFFCLLLLPDTKILSVAYLTIFWIIATSPITLRYSKIIWAKTLYKQKTRA